MKFEIQPTADRLLVKPITAEEISKGGVIIPDTAQEKPQQAVVAAAGPDVGQPKFAGGELLPTRKIREGDRVLYGKYSGTEVTVDGEDYLILREGDIMAVLRPLQEAPAEDHPYAIGSAAGGVAGCTCKHLSGDVDDCPIHTAKEGP